MSEMARLIEPHIPALRRYAWALLRDRHLADDLVQDCLERAVSRWHLRRRDGNLRSWLFTILHNLYVSRQRRRLRESAVVVPDAAGFAAPSVEDPAQAIAVRDLVRGLGALPEEQRAAVLLVGVEDMSYQEASAVLGVPVGTLMSRLSRGRDRLRRLVDGEAPATLRRIK